MIKIFCRVARRVADHPGVAFYTSNQSLREIIEALILVYEVMLPEEMVGQIEYL